MTRNKGFNRISTYLMLVICVTNFLRIDASSHSASDTIRPFIFETLLLYIIYKLIQWKLYHE